MEIFKDKYSKDTYDRIKSICENYNNLLDIDGHFVFSDDNGIPAIIYCIDNDTDVLFSCAEGPMEITNKDACDFIKYTKDRVVENDNV